MRYPDSDVTLTDIYSTTTDANLLFPGGMEIDEWNGTYQEIACWDSLVIDLGKQTWIGKLVYYEDVK